MSSTVLIVDDHASFRRAATSMLRADGLTVVGEAADGREAIALVERLKPEIVLLDVQLPGADGFAVAEDMSRLEPPPVIILISSRAEKDYGARVAASPARGFIPKAGLTRAAVEALLRDAGP